MISIEDDDFLSQELPFRDFRESGTQLEANLLSDISSIAEKPLDYKLDRLGKNRVKTLFIISESSPNQLQMLEIADKGGIHRSTVSVHVKELEEVALIDKGILPGTENKYNPTYLYRLKPSVDKQRVREAFEAKFPNDPLLNPAIASSQAPPSGQQDSLNESDLSDTARNAAQKTPFEQQIAQAITKMAHNITQMAQEITSLRSRVRELEEKLEQESRRGEEVDLTEALNLLNLDLMQNRQAK